MGWMETLTKEAFFTAVREAVKPEFETLENRLESEIKGVTGQIKGLEGEISGMKSQMDSIQRQISSLDEKIDYKYENLEGKIENIHTSVKSFFNETRADFYEKLYEKRIEVSKPPLPENTSEQYVVITQKAPAPDLPSPGVFL